MEIVDVDRYRSYRTRITFDDIEDLEDVAKKLKEYFEVFTKEKYTLKGPKKCDGLVYYEVSDRYHPELFVCVEEHLIPSNSFFIHEGRTDMFHDFSKFLEGFVKWKNEPAATNDRTAGPEE